MTIRYRATVYGSAPRLLDRMREALQLRRYSRRTEEVRTSADRMFGG